jgi:hypothetical protein
MIRLSTEKSFKLVSSIPTSSWNSLITVSSGVSQNSKVPHGGIQHQAQIF